MAQIKKITRPFGDWIILISSVLIIAFILFIGYKGVVGGIGLINASTSPDSDWFFGALVLAIAAGCMYFLEIFITTLSKVVRNIFRKDKEVK